MDNVLLLYGQSNYDIALKVYGGLDNIVKLCNDSEAADLNQSVKQYSFDENFISDNNITGFNYKTDAKLQIGGGRYYGDVYGDTYS